METLQRLADALGVELTELLDGVPSADARRAVLRRLCIAGAVTLILAGLWAYLHAVCLRQYQRGGMALVHNQQALTKFSALTDEEKRAFIAGVHGIDSRQEMREIGALICRLIDEGEAAVPAVRAQVLDRCARFPLYPDLQM